jgi:hypothetical protein
MAIFWGYAAGEPSSKFRPRYLFIAGVRAMLPRPLATAQGVSAGVQRLNQLIDQL